MYMRRTTRSDRLAVTISVICLLLTIPAWILGGPTATAKTTHKTTRDIPLWVVRPCRTENSSNCRWNPRDHSHSNVHFKDDRLINIRRTMPGPTHTICVFFPSRPRLDYCD
jgi:hypothetical protein